eukprot:g6516.t1
MTLSCNDACCSHSHSHAAEKRHNSHSHNDIAEKLKSTTLEEKEKNGIIVCADSKQLLEEMARLPLVKGVYWKRCKNKFESRLAKWLSHQEEDLYEAFAYEQLLVCEEPLTQRAYQKVTGIRKRKVASFGDIKAACDRLVADIPIEFRSTIRNDAESLAEILTRLCPKVRWLTFQLEIIGNNACSRWHQDNYVGRMIITYVGPGTWIVADKDVAYDQFRKTLGQSMEVSDPLIVPSFDTIHRTKTNSMLLMKGSQWPGISGVPGHEGLTHKAPNVAKLDDGTPETKRLLLKVDLSNRKPGR